MIYLECYNDVSLVRSFGVHLNIITHSGTKSRVLAHLDSKLNGIGVIDEDYNEYIPILSNYKEKERRGKLRLLKHVDYPKYVIILPGNLEEWWLKMSTEADIDLSSISGLLTHVKKFRKKYLPIF